MDDSDLISGGHAVTTSKKGCHEEDISWEPLDMQGSSPTEEVDAMACQRRCLGTPGCFHFTFWKVYGHCHLEDAFALRREDRSGFVSGPFQCWDEIRHSGLAQVKDGNGKSFLPAQFHCMEVGVSWAPAMQLPKRFEGSEIDMIMQCQHFCAMTKSCARFTMEVGSRTCHLATAKASALPGVFNSISGPPVCSSRQADVFMKKKLQKKYSDGGAEGSIGSRASFLATLATIVAVAGLSASVLHFWRGYGRTCDAQLGESRAIHVAFPTDDEHDYEFEE